MKYSEIPITFSREDQWTSFSEPGKFPLVLDLVVQGSKLTLVLIAEPTQPHRSQPALRPSAPAAARQRPPVSDFFARGTPTMVDEAASAWFSFSTPARVCLIVASCL